MRGQNGELVVPVNNSLVCHMAFVAAEHKTVCLDNCAWELGLLTSSHI